MAGSSFDFFLCSRGLPVHQPYVTDLEGSADTMPSSTTCRGVTDRDGRHWNLEIFFTRSLILWYVCRKWPWFVFCLGNFEHFWMVIVTLKFYESGGSIDVHSSLVWVDIFPVIYFDGTLGPRKCCQSRIYTVPYSVCWDETSIRVKRPSSTGGKGDDADGKWRFIWIPS